MAKVLSPMPVEIRAQIEAMALEVAELVPDAAYANYMILDPTRPDPTSILPGAPIYVGQSGCVARRIKSHMRRALMQSVRRGSLYERIVAIVRAGAMPIFRVLQLYPTRLESVRGETIWAQRLLQDGACLYNRWPEQSRVMAGKELARRQRRRLFDLSLAEASEAGAALEARCCRDGWHVAIGAEHLLPRFGKLVTFHSVRRTLRECPQCGGRLRHAIVMEADQPCIDRRAG